MIFVMQQVESLIQIKRQIVLLGENEKQDLAEFLAEELSGNFKSRNHESVSDEERRLQLEWLKVNREKYAGKYVALSGNKLAAKV